jgi:hypothetical protein
MNAAQQLIEQGRREAMNAAQQLVEQVRKEGRQAARQEAVEHFVRPWPQRSRRAALR